MTIYCFSWVCRSISSSAERLAGLISAGLIHASVGSWWVSLGLDGSGWLHLKGMSLFTWPLVLQQASPGLLLWQWQVPSGEAKAQNCTWCHFCHILLAKASLQLNLDQGEESKVPRSHILRWHSFSGVDITHTHMTLRVKFFLKFWALDPCLPYPGPSLGQKARPDLQEKQTSPLMQTHIAKVGRYGWREKEARPSTQSTTGKILQTSIIRVEPNVTEQSTEVYDP